MARRRMPPERRWQVMEHAAWRRIGHEHAYAIAFGPYVWRLVLLVAAVGALTFLWVKVPHLYLGVGAFALAALVGAGWLIYTGSTQALQRRMAARARGGDPRGAGLGWAVAGFVALLGAVGWLSLWSPYA